MKYIVTGGCGFIGYHLVKRLLNDGHSVIVIDSLESEYSKNNFKQMKKMINVSFLTESIQQNMYYDSFNVDGVFHLAATPRVQKSFDNLEETTRNNTTSIASVLKMVLYNNIPKIVFSSSSTTKGNSSPYAIQKLFGEEMMRLYNDLGLVETVSLRLHSVYGPNMDKTGDYPLVIPAMLNAVYDNKPFTLYGDGGQKRDFTYVEDVVQALILAMEHPTSGEVYDIGFGNPISINRLRLIINDITGFVIFGKEMSSRVEERETRANSMLFSEKFGWKPKISIIEGLKKLIEEDYGTR